MRFAALALALACARAFIDTEAWVGVEYTPTSA